MWKLKTDPNKAEDKPLLCGDTAVFTRLLIKDAGALDRICSIWSLDRQKAKQLMQQIWIKDIAPKVSSFLWLLAGRALPTWERSSEWLIEKGIAFCRGPCAGVPNSSVHVLTGVGELKQFGVRWLNGCRLNWADESPWPSGLSCCVAESAVEEGLVKETWWRTWRAWTLHQLWVAWMAFAFGGKQHPSAVSVAQIAWQKTIQACRARWQTQRIDPAKGLPKLPDAFVKLDMAQQDGGGKSLGEKRKKEAFRCLTLTVAAGSIDGILIAEQHELRVVDFCTLMTKVQATRGMWISYLFCRLLPGSVVARLTEPGMTTSVLPGSPLSTHASKQPDYHIHPEVVEPSSAKAGSGKVCSQA